MDVRAGQLFCQGPERLAFSLNSTETVRRHYEFET